MGAIAASVIETLTGIHFTPDIYHHFLHAALKNNLATSDSENKVQVSPAILHLLTSEKFRSTFPSSKISLTYRQDLSMYDISKTVIALKSKKNEMGVFVLCPVSSWLTQGGGHIVALQEIQGHQVAVYDPNHAKLKTLTLTEFNHHWDYAFRSAIFVFAQPPHPKIPL
jgi:hypothetical protein